MAVPVFPLSLENASVQDNFSEGIPNRTLRYAMDKGTKVRNNGSVSPSTLTVDYVLDQEQWEILVNFVENTLANGAIAFDYTHPVSRKKVRAGILPISEEEMITRSMLGRNEFSVSIKFEIFYNVPV